MPAPRRDDDDDDAARAFHPPKARVLAPAAPPDCRRFLASARRRRWAWIRVARSAMAEEDVEHHETWHSARQSNPEVFPSSSIMECQIDILTRGKIQ